MEIDNRIQLKPLLARVTINELMSYCYQLFMNGGLPVDDPITKQLCADLYTDPDELNKIGEFVNWVITRMPSKSEHVNLLAAGYLPALLDSLRGSDDLAAGLLREQFGELYGLGYAIYQNGRTLYRDHLFLQELLCQLNTVLAEICTGTSNYTISSEDDRAEHQHALGLVSSIARNNRFVYLFPEMYANIGNIKLVELGYGHSVQKVFYYDPNTCAYCLFTFTNKSNIVNLFEAKR